MPPITQASEVIFKTDLNQLYNSTNYSSCNWVDRITIGSPQHAKHTLMVTTEFCPVFSKNVYQSHPCWSDDTCAAPRDPLLMGAQETAVYSSLPRSNHQSRPIVPHQQHKWRASFGIIAPARRRQRPKLRLIINEHASISQNIGRCDIMSSMGDSWAHIKGNEQKLVHYYQCHLMGCSRKFKRKTDLKRHHQSVHSRQCDWNCAYCARCFSRKDSLRR